MEACRDSKGISTIRNRSLGGGVDGWGGCRGLQPNIHGNLYKSEEEGEEAARHGNPQTAIFRFLVRSTQRARLSNPGRLHAAGTTLLPPFPQFHLISHFASRKLTPYFMAVSRKSVQ